MTDVIRSHCRGRNGGRDWPAPDRARRARPDLARGARPGERRARPDAGMVDVGDADLVAQATVILSVVPPGEAVGLAERLKPALARATARTDLHRLSTP